MNDLIDRALDAADRGGAAYADVRVVERIAREALEIAHASALAQNTPVRLDETPPVTASEGGA